MTAPAPKAHAPGSVHQFGSWLDLSATSYMPRRKVLSPHFSLAPVETKDDF